MTNYNFGSSFVEGIVGRWRQTVWVKRNAPRIMKILGIKSDVAKEEILRTLTKIEKDRTVPKKFSPSPSPHSNRKQGSYEVKILVCHINYDGCVGSGKGRSVPRICIEWRSISYPGMFVDLTPWINVVTWIPYSENRSLILFSFKKQKLSSGTSKWRANCGLVVGCNFWRWKQRALKGVLFFFGTIDFGQPPSCLKATFHFPSLSPVF